jgi:metal-sulfur cluster biosynthetic enzyme
MTDPEALRQAILARLSQVIDPETGVDVVRMRLIEDLVVDSDGYVSYKFRPSSPFCPIAIPLSDAIQQAVAEVGGVTEQKFEIVGFALGDELMNWLKQAMEEDSSGKTKTKYTAKEQK